jgi:transposase-like protein
VRRKRLFYRAGYRLARARAAAELAEMRELRDELRQALTEWRHAVEDRREKETALVEFYRDSAKQERDATLH